VRPADIGDLTALFCPNPPSEQSEISVQFCTGHMGNAFRDFTGSVDTMERESSAAEERLRFVARQIKGEAMTELCLEFWISPKTGYKIFNRCYEENELAAPDSGGAVVFDKLCRRRGRRPPSARLLLRKVALYRR